MIGIVCIVFSILAYVQNILGDNVLRFKFKYTNFSFLASIGVALGCALLATHACKDIANSEGSGLPEMRMLMTGSPVNDFFNFNIFRAKFFSTLWGKVAGIGNGCFAPFIHMALIITHHISRVPYFRKVKSDYNMQVSMLAVTCISPIVLFFSPIGSIFFSVEFFGQTIKQYTLFKLVFAAILSYFTCNLLNRFIGFSWLPQVRIQTFESTDLVLFAVLGIVGALWAYLTLYILSIIIYIKRIFPITIFTNRYIYTVICATIIIILTYQHSFFAQSMRNIFFDFLTIDDLAIEKSYTTFWYKDDRFLFKLELLYVLSVRTFMIILMMTMPVAGGAFGPLFMVGITLGRLFGEFAVDHLNTTTSPSVFALCGSSLVVALIVRAFSPILFVIELSRNF